MMTDDEIIKALECCTNIELDCEKDCPIYDYCEENSSNMAKAVLDLINRQKAEIENHNVEVNKMVAEIERLKRLLVEEEEKYKLCAKRFYKEAIKELMFNLDNEISTYSSAGKDLNVYAWLKNYAKEKIGE